MALAPVPSPFETHEPPTPLDRLARAVWRQAVQVFPVIPGMCMLVGLVTVLVGAMHDYSTTPDALSSFSTMPIFGQILFIVGLVLQLQHVLAADLGVINRILSSNLGYRADELEDKLESLDVGLSVSRRALSKIRPLLQLAIFLVAFGFICAMYQTASQMDYAFNVTNGNYGFQVGSRTAYLEELQAMPVILRIVLFDIPPLALVSGVVLLGWHVYQRSQLKNLRNYMTDERTAVIGKKRIVDRFEARYVELSSLTEQVADLVRRTEQQATSDARKNSSLLLLGVVLSALISIVGVLGSADLLNWPVRLNGNVISAILGVVVAAIISIQNTFRLPEKAEFQKRVASDGRSLFVDLVFNVDTEEKLTEIVQSYQRLSDRSLRDLPSVKDLDALGSLQADRQGQERDRNAS
jgi:hypothetical protein